VVSHRAIIVVSSSPPRQKTNEEPKSQRAKEQTKDSQIRHIPPSPLIKLDPMRSVPLFRSITHQMKTNSP
jgi:hypothetical protein